MEEPACSNTVRCAACQRAAAWLCAGSGFPEAEFQPGAAREAIRLAEPQRGTKSKVASAPRAGTDTLMPLTARPCVCRRSRKVRRKETAPSMFGSVLGSLLLQSVLLTKTHVAALWLLACSSLILENMRYTVSYTMFNWTFMRPAGIVIK